MAIALDQTSLGNASNNASATTIAFNTGANVASDGTLFVLVHYAGAQTVTVAGGSLTWTEEAHRDESAIHTALFRANAPSGLASATTITATFSAAVTGRIIAGCSFTGLATAAKEDSGTIGLSNTVWTSATMDPTTAENLTITAVTLDTNVGHTVTAPSLEALDSGASFDYRFAIIYRIETSAGAYTNGGTFAASGLIIGATGAYGATAAVGGARNMMLLGVG